MSAEYAPQGICKLNVISSTNIQMCVEMRVPENGPYFSVLEGVSPNIDRYPICAISLLAWHQLSLPVRSPESAFPSPRIAFLTGDPELTAARPWGLLPQVLPGSIAGSWYIPVFTAHLTGHSLLWPCRGFELFGNASLAGARTTGNLQLLPR